MAGNFEPQMQGKPADEELDRLFWSRAAELERQMMALPSTCAADFAAKAIVDSAEGGALTDWETGLFWQEARALVKRTEGTNQGVVSPGSPKATVSAVLLEHLQNMQDLQCTLCGLLDILARTFPEKLGGSQSEGDFLTLLDAIKRQAQVVNAGLDTLNLSEIGGLGAPEGGDH